MRERENWAVLHINSARRKQISINSRTANLHDMTMATRERFLWCQLKVHSGAGRPRIFHLPRLPEVLRLISSRLERISGVDLWLAWSKTTGDDTGWRKRVVSIFSYRFLDFKSRSSWMNANFMLSMIRHHLRTLLTRIIKVSLPISEKNFVFWVLI